MASKRETGADLAAKMLATLESLRAIGNDSYPPSVKRLAELAESHADWPLVTKALTNRAFSSRALVSRRKDPDALVALVDDAETLSDSPVLLEQILESVCTPEQRTWPVSKLKTHLAPSLRARFEHTWRIRIDSGQMPSSIGSVRIGRTDHLFLRRLPYIAPEQMLAERIVRVLDSHRAPTSDAPLSLRQLTALADPRASAALVKKALTEEPFRTRALSAFAKPTPDSLVVLQDDLDALANSPRLLEALVAAARTATTSTSTPAAWKKKLDPRLWSAFQEALAKRTESGTLPLTVCWLKIRGKAHYFLRFDLNGGTIRSSDAAVVHESATNARTVGSTAPLRSGKREEDATNQWDEASTADFGQRFDAAFERLNRATGGHNFVSLFDLRKAIAVDRPNFDAGLQTLRFNGRYTLSAAEGRHGLRPDERDAGIMEDGTLLLYVARRNTP